MPPHKTPFAILLALFWWLNPLITIAGDTVYIRAGIYRETVTPTNSGTVSNPLTFRNYENETVMINGADVISSEAWMLDSGNIYHTPLASNFFVPTFNQALQVFADGEMVTLAKWPNVTSKTNTYPSGTAPAVSLSHPAKSTTTPSRGPVVSDRNKVFFDFF